jgi:ubiquinone/menaquinone biosynthesis C-methylase UbiE
MDIELAHAIEEIQILAIDGAQQMIDLARQRIENHQLSTRISVKAGRLPHLALAEKEFDLIISKDLLHHLPEPAVFWEEVERLATEATQIFVMDLIRPATLETAADLVEALPPETPAILKTDFYNSLLAAFTEDEIRSQLSSTKLEYHLERLGSRHFVVRCQKFQ